MFPTLVNLTIGMLTLMLQQGGGSQMGMGFAQVGSSSSLGERVVSSAWMPETTAPTPFSGSPPSFIPGLMGPGNQSAGPPSVIIPDSFFTFNLKCDGFWVFILYLYLA